MKEERVMEIRKNSVDLLLKDDMRLMLILCKTRVVGEDVVQLSSHIVDILLQLDVSYFDTFMTRAIREKIFVHLKKERNLPELFRDNSVTSLVFSTYIRSEGKAYTQKIITPVIKKIAAFADKMEIDPHKIKQSSHVALSEAEIKKIIEENQKRLNEATTMVMDAILESESLLPNTIRRVCRLIWQEINDEFLVARMRKLVQETNEEDKDVLYNGASMSMLSLNGSANFESTSGVSAISEHLDGHALESIASKENSALELLQAEMKDQKNILTEKVLGSLIFLRYFIPAVVTSEKHGIVLDDVKLDAMSRRGLILIGKVLTNLCNQVQFGMKEHCMMVMNGFLHEYNIKMKVYLQKLASNISIMKIRSQTSNSGKLKGGFTSMPSLVMSKAYDDINVTKKTTLATTKFSPISIFGTEKSKEAAKIKSFVGEQIVSIESVDNLLAFFHEKNSLVIAAFDELVSLDPDTDYNDERIDLFKLLENAMELEKGFNMNSRKNWIMMMIGAFTGRKPPKTRPAISNSSSKSNNNLYNSPGQSRSESAGNLDSAFKPSVAASPKRSRNEA